MQSVIEVINLKKTYSLPRQSQRAGVKQFDAVKGVSFSVEQGEIFGILGPNGAGKTTTLEIIEGLKQQTSGSVAVLGISNETDPVAIKRRIGVQLQESDYLPRLTLSELLRLFASLYNRTVDPLEMLRFVDLEHKAGEQVANLSGGQKQRFTLASSLVNDPAILFLDEPTTGLDPRARRKVWELIRQINARGITVVLTTHYMEEAEYLCHRVAIMDEGRLLAIEQPKTLIGNLAHTTQVSFLTNSKLAESLWQPLGDNIEKVYSSFPKVILEVKNLDLISSILEILKQNRIEFSGFTVKTASLEDVYLDLTGKEYQE